MNKNLSPLLLPPEPKESCNPEHQHARNRALQTCHDSTLEAAESIRITQEVTEKVKSTISEKLAIELNKNPRKNEDGRVIDKELYIQMIQGFADLSPWDINILEQINESVLSQSILVIKEYLNNPKSSVFAFLKGEVNTYKNLWSGVGSAIDKGGAMNMAGFSLSSFIVGGLIGGVFYSKDGVKQTFKSLAKSKAAWGIFGAMVAEGAGLPIISTTTKFTGNLIARYPAIIGINSSEKLDQILSWNIEGFMNFNAYDHVLENNKAQIGLMNGNPKYSSFLTKTNEYQKKVLSFNHDIHSKQKELRAISLSLTPEDTYTNREESVKKLIKEVEALIDKIDAIAAPQFTDEEKSAFMAVNKKSENFIYTDQEYQEKLLEFNQNKVPNREAMERFIFTNLHRSGLSAMNHSDLVDEFEALQEETSTNEVSSSEEFSKEMFGDNRAQIETLISDQHNKKLSSHGAESFAKLGVSGGAIASIVFAYLSIQMVSFVGRSLFNRDEEKAKMPDSEKNKAKLLQLVQKKKWKKTAKTLKSSKYIHPEEYKKLIKLPNNYQKELWKQLEASENKDKFVSGSKGFWEIMSQTLKAGNVGAKNPITIDAFHMRKGQRVSDHFPKLNGERKKSLKNIREFLSKPTKHKKFKKLDLAFKKLDDLDSYRNHSTAIAKEENVINKRKRYVTWGKELMTHYT